MKCPRFQTHRLSVLKNQEQSIFFVILLDCFAALILAMTEGDTIDLLQTLPDSKTLEFLAK
jgi:hypothetical protein